MVPKRFRKSISATKMLRYGRGLWLLLAVIFFAVNFFSDSSDYPRPTPAFYMNDFAGVFLQGTRDTVTVEGEYLYEFSQDLDDGGAQVVIATFEVDTLSDIEDYDKTELYRAWKIGDDDMGVLIILYFMYDDTLADHELVGTDIEVGYRMEPYLTPTRLGLIVDGSLYNDEYNWLIDVAVAKLHNDILNEIYVDAYDDVAIDFDPDDYFDFLMDYDPIEYDDSTNAMSTWVYLLSPYTTGWTKFSIALPYLFLALFGGTSFLIGNTGGGGSSGGMGLRRRR